MKVLSFKAVFNAPVVEIPGQVRGFRGKRVFQNLIQRLLSEMMDHMLDGTVQFQEKKLVLQESLALETGADILLVGIEEQLAEGCTNHHHGDEQEPQAGGSRRKGRFQSVSS